MCVGERRIRCLGIVTEKDSTNTMTHTAFGRAKPQTADAETVRQSVTDVWKIMSG